MTWPLPRAMHGQLLEQIAVARPAAIGVDLLFPEPSARGEADDAAFAASLARVRNVVMAAAITQVSEGFYTKVDLNAPVLSLRRSAAAVGTVGLPVDLDGVVRHAVLTHWISDLRVPAFAVAVHDVARANGVATQPVPAGNEVTIHFVGAPGTFQRLSYHRVLRGQFPQEAVRGRVVLVGVTSSSLRDVSRTPTATKDGMPGVEVQANVVDTLLTGRAMRTLPRWAATIAATIAALGAATVVTVAGPRGLLLVLVALAGVAVCSLVGFAAAHV